MWKMSPVFSRKGVLKIFAKFKVKHLMRVSYNEVANLRLYSKRDSSTGIS